MAEAKHAASETTQTDADQFPDTWEKLTARNPIIAKLPRLTPPQSLDFDQSADFKIVDTMLTTKFDEIVNPPEGVDPVEAQVKAMNLGGVMKNYFHGIADDGDAFDAALLGLDANSVFLALVDLTVYYRLMVGKQTDSVLNSTSAE